MNLLSALINIALVIVGVVITMTTELSFGTLISITLPYLIIGIMIGINYSKNIQSRNK